MMKEVVVTGCAQKLLLQRSCLAGHTHLYLLGAVSQKMKCRRPKEIKYIKLSRCKSWLTKRLLCDYQGSMPLYSFGCRMWLSITIYQQHCFISDIRLLSYCARVLGSGKTCLLESLQTSAVVEKKITDSAFLSTSQLSRWYTMYKINISDWEVTLERRSEVNWFTCLSWCMS